MGGLSGTPILCVSSEIRDLNCRADPPSRFAQVDKIVLIDSITRKLRASFQRLGAVIGKTDWATVFEHYDVDRSGGL